MALSLTACGAEEETPLTGMVVSVDGTVISLMEMDTGNMGGKDFAEGERPEKTAGEITKADLMDLGLYGPGSSDRRALRPMVTATYHLGLAWAVIMAVVFVVLRRPMAELFTDNEAVVVLTSELMMLIAVYQFSDAVQGLSISMMRGLQDVKIIMPIVLCSYLVLSIPIGCWLAFGLDMGCHGLVVGLIVGLSAAAILTFLRLRVKTAQLIKG